MVEGFTAPKIVWKLEQVLRSVNSVKLRLFHGLMNALQLSSSYYELKATYEIVHENVSNIIP